jgi:hypothetical protein
MFDFSTNKPNHTLLHRLSSLQYALETWLTSASSPDLQVNAPFRGDQPASPEDTQLDRTRASLWLLTRESLCRICLLLVAECIDGLQNLESTAPHPVVAANIRAEQLKATAQSLARAAKVPVCTARAVSAPLHFLTRYYAIVGDTAGLQWCICFKDDILKSARWLRWDVLLPWSFLTIHDVPTYRV